MDMYDTPQNTQETAPTETNETINEDIHTPRAIYLRKKKEEYYRHQDGYLRRSKEFYVKIKDQKAAQYIIARFNSTVFPPPKKSTIKKHLDSVLEELTRLGDVKTCFKLTQFLSTA